MAKRILIIGRGLAGAILSLRLQERGISHHIIDQPKLSSSSRVAAGLVNPIVLKRLKVVQQAAEYLAEAEPFYRKWERNWGEAFYQQVPIYHLLHDPAEANQWNELSEGARHAPYLGDIVRLGIDNLPAPHGFGIVKQSGWLDTKHFLHLQQKELGASIELREEVVTTTKLAELQEQYEKVIIANGHLARELVPACRDYFSPTRGEVMVIKAAGLPGDKILHGPVFILPLGGNAYKVGATYHWDALNDQVSGEGIDQLRSRLEKIYQGSYELLQHQAGVRPNVKDRKPLLGHLKDNLYLFNGLGSRGVLMAPLLSNLFCDYLFEQKALIPEFDLQRFKQ